MPPLRTTSNNDLNKHTTRSGKTYSSPYPSKANRDAGREAVNDQSSERSKRNASSQNSSKAKTKKKNDTKTTVEDIVNKSHEAARRAIHILRESGDMLKGPKYYAISPPPSYAHSLSGSADYHWGRELKEVPHDYPWVASEKTMELVNIHNLEVFKRDQDAFGMHIYSDYTGYGIEEVLENQMNMFSIVMKDKEPNALRLWTLLSAFAHWTKMNEEVMGEWSGRDDADGWRDSNFMIGMMTLATLNALERVGLLEEKSPIKDLGLVLALIGDFVYDQWEIQEEVPCFLSEKAQRWQREHLLEPLPDNLAEPPVEACWSYVIVDYARRHSIKIEGVHGIKERFLEKFGDADKAKLWDPRRGPDRWGWRSKYVRFVRQNGREVITPTGKTILGVGGMNYDILEMPKQERTEANFLHVDPLDPTNPNNVLDNFSFDVGTVPHGEED